jgi:NAD(P)-dependent dehydrogenase (short-subunit alcohol dehydrogenase family)
MAALSAKNLDFFGDRANHVQYLADNRLRHDKQARKVIKQARWLLLRKAAARVMIEKGIKGSIINMSSINAVFANPTAVAYAVSKGGIKRLTARRMRSRT